MMRPLLCFPPRPLFSLVLVLRLRFLRDDSAHNLEEERSPLHDALLRGLVRAEVGYNGNLVCLCDEVQQVACGLRGGIQWCCGEELLTDVDEDGHDLLGDPVWDVALVPAVPGGCSLRQYLRLHSPCDTRSTGMSW